MSSLPVGMIDLESVEMFSWTARQWTLPTTFVPSWLALSLGLPPLTLFGNDPNGLEWEGIVKFINTYFIAWLFMRKSCDIIVF